MFLYVWEFYRSQSSIFGLYNWFWLRQNDVAGKALLPLSCYCKDHSQLSQAQSLIK